jgi:hypothetical protein
MYADPIEATPVDNIASYTGNDPYVYDQTARKFYAYNNQGVYEEYGIVTKVNSLKVSGGGATEIEYIKTNSSMATIPYINLNYIPKKNSRAVAAMIAETGADWKAAYGCGYYNAGWKDRFCFFTTNATINLGGETGNKDAMRYGEKIVTVLDAVAGKMDIFEADGTTLIGTINDSPKTDDCKTPLYVFAQNKDVPDGGKQTDCYNPGLTLYSLALYEGETLAMDLVPIVDSEGKGGLKDKLTGTIYLPANNGNFELSADGQAIAAESGTTVYKGKIVINTKDNHEYKWNGTAWDDLGAITTKAIEQTAYKNMNNWTCRFGYEETYGHIEYDAENNSNFFNPYNGKGDWEPYQCKLEGLTAGETYKVSFNFSSKGWNSWSSYTQLPFFASNTWDFGRGLVPTGVGGEVLGFVGLTNQAVENEPYSFDFTTDKEEAVLAIQFGVGDDYKDFFFRFSNLDVVQYVYPGKYDEITYKDTQKYTPLAYIESVSAALENVFEFPYKPTTDTKVNVKFWTDKSEGWRAVFSARNTYAGTGMSLYINGNDNAHIGYFTGGTTGGGDNRAPFELGQEYVAECTVGNLKLNDVDYPTGETACNPTSRNFTIFANPEWDNAFHGRIWYFKITEGEEEICNYIPVIRHDGVFGFYDTIKGDFVMSKKGLDGYTYQIAEDQAYVCFVPGARTVPLDATANYQPTIQKLENIALTWKSSDENIATVAADGTVTGKAMGKVQITCTTDADGGWVATYTLEVTQRIEDSYQFAEGSVYGTYVAPFDITKIHSKVQAFAVEIVDGGFAKLNEITAIPKGAAVVLKDNGTGHKYTFKKAEDSVEALTGNDLKAATEEVTADGTQFILAKLEDKVGFAKATPDTKIAAGKGYLVISAAVKAFYPFMEEGTTAIESLTPAISEGDGTIYNVAGQRVNNAQKGIYIVNGKKILK